MECKLPCYTQPKFNYASIDCYLKKNSIQTDNSINVVYMVKNQNTGGFTYREKPVLYFVPKDRNSQTALAYIIPGHSDGYVYMYMLSVPLGAKTYSGEHFTFGNKPNGGFDLHYTTYDYVSGNRPYHIYYDLNIKENTSPADVSRIVCSKQGSSRREEFMNRCYFFDAVMQAVHSGSCEGNFNKAFQTLQGKTPLPNRGGAKKKAPKQRGGNDNKEDEDILEANLAEALATVPNLVQVEIHVMPDLKGMLTFFLETETDAIVVKDDGHSQISKHKTQIPYAFPYDFVSNEFMSLDECMAILKGTSSTANSSTWWRRKITDVCPNEITNLYFSDRTRVQSSSKGCGVESNMGVPQQKVFFTSLPPISGGKQKTDKKKGIKKISKRKEQ